MIKTRTALTIKEQLLTTSLFSENNIQHDHDSMREKLIEMFLKPTPAVKEMFAYFFIDGHVNFVPFRNPVPNKESKKDGENKDCMNEKHHNTPTNVIGFPIGYRR
ncbi:hypothetical protein DICVIV_08587 [Dictyocaulus viviparus]|uniref:Uncharacterized protein n=1 Tax=Dictyocaulus viviparus TaxID=29172 RepID=A0A0D8XNK2_DICVI|nr:hypothetical protein DICVIV_08587 [Dictyocaulus viviparus]